MLQRWCPPRGACGATHPNSTFTYSTCASRHAISAPVGTHVLKRHGIVAPAATRKTLAEVLRASPSILLHIKPKRPTPFASALPPDSVAPGSAGHTPPSYPSAPSLARTPAPILEPARLVSALEKLAAAGHTPEPHWLDMFLAACQPALPQLGLGQLATLARSLDRLGVEVPLLWMQALVQASYDALPAAARAGDVADLLRWLAADGRLVPEPSWVGTALQQIQILFRSRPADLTAGQAADVAWAVARLGYRPADTLLDSLAAATMGPYASYDSGGGGDQDGGEDDVWGGEAGEEQYAGLGPGGQAAAAAAPSPYGVGGSGAGGESLATLPPAQLSRLAWALASYNYFPSDPWVRLYLLEGIWCRGLSPEGATAVLWSLGAMQLPAEDMWLRNYYLLTTRRLHEVPPEGLVNAMWALAACREVERAAPPRQRRRQPPQSNQRQPAPGSDRTLEAPPSTSAASAGAAVDSIAMRSSTVRQQPAEVAAAAAAAEDADGGSRGGEKDVEAVEETDEDRETYGRVAAALEGQLAAMARLRESGSPRQQQALEQLEAALQRRLAREHPDGMGADGDGDAGSRSSSTSTSTSTSSGGSGIGNTGDDGSRGGAGSSGGGGGDDGVREDVEAYLPAEWAAEWYDATLPYLRQLDKTLLVKALWAAASLELRPPPAWLSQLAAAATAVLLAEGVAEPLELLYASRSADGLLLAQRRRSGPAATAAGAWAWAGEGHADKEGEEDGDGEGRQAREALARFAAESFQRLSRQQLPASWRRLNQRFPPYAQPRPGVLGPGTAGSDGGGGGGEGEGEPSGGQTAGTTALGPPVPRAGLLRPFR